MQTDNSYLPNTPSTRRVVDRVYNIIVCRIQTITTVPFFYGFSHAMVSQIRLSVDFRMNTDIANPLLPSHYEHSRIQHRIE